MKNLNKLYLLRALKVFVLAGIPLLGFVYAYQFTGQSREVIVPFQVTRAPLTSLPVAFSERTQKLEFTTPITVVNFWATWCPPCVEEFPAMLELQRQLKGKGVNFVFISVDDSWGAIEKFRREMNLQVKDEEVFLDKTKVAASEWGSSKFPETYVVRQDGWILEKIIGAQQWTRPAVVEYFSDLAQKHGQISKQARTFPQLFIESAQAQESRSGNILHEDDKKNLDKLRANIDTASKNLRAVEAANRDEKRNLEEQRIVLERKSKDEAEAQKEVDKLQGKKRDVKTILERNTDSQKAERSEKKSAEGRIKDIQEKIKDLQKDLEEAKSQLVQANKDLNTRTQQIETYDEAKKSSEEELSELDKKLKYAEKIQKERAEVVSKAKSELRSREGRVKELDRDVSRAQRSLDEQKKKLSDFEKILER